MASKGLMTANNVVKVLMNRVKCSSMLLPLQGRGFERAVDLARNVTNIGASPVHLGQVGRKPESCS
jgi:hypothetical protein